VKLKNGTLEILYAVQLPVYGASLIEFVRDWEALLRQSAVTLPVCAEYPAESLSSLAEKDSALCAGSLAGRTGGAITLSVLEDAEEGEEHVKRSLILRVSLKDCPLEILQTVRLTVRVGALLHKS